MEQSGREIGSSLSMAKILGTVNVNYSYTDGSSPVNPISGSLVVPNKLAGAK